MGGSLSCAMASNLSGRSTKKTKSSPQAFCSVRMCAVQTEALLMYDTSDAIGNEVLRERSGDLSGAGYNGHRHRSRSCCPKTLTRRSLETAK